jgi:hypothetical protein
MELTRLWQSQEVCSNYGTMRRLPGENTLKVFLTGRAARIIALQPFKNNILQKDSKYPYNQFHARHKLSCLQIIKSCIPN